MSGMWMLGFDFEGLAGGSDGTEAVEKTLTLWMVQRKH